MKKMINPQAIKAALQAAAWIGAGWTFGALVPDLVISRVGALSSLAAKGPATRAALKGVIGAAAAYGSMRLIGKRIPGADRAAKYLYGGVALGAAGPLVVTYAQQAVAKLDGLLPAPGGYVAGMPLQGEFDAPGGELLFLPAAGGSEPFPAPEVSLAGMRSLP